MEIECSFLYIAGPLYFTYYHTGFLAFVILSVRRNITISLFFRFYLFETEEGGFIAFETRSEVYIPFYDTH